MGLEVLDWGLIDYQQALDQQLELVEKVSFDHSRGFLVFCSHPAVVTLGRKAQAEDVFAWQGPTIEVSRGGKATYHGPNQLVIYPIVNLNFATAVRREKDLAQFLSLLADSIAEVLQSYGLDALGKTGGEETGVWLGSRKLASIGIAVKNWVSYHGAALNIDQDAQAFLGMRPCGFDRSVMLSLEEALEKKISRIELQNKLSSCLLQKL
jgi:lipoate-protein ligase B